MLGWRGRSPQEGPLTFNQVFAAEEEHLYRTRYSWRHADRREKESASGPNGENRRKKPASFVGLALSGGGIRSATFNLGLLQSLARAKILPLVDYLSTVSGGGYIGSWLTAWANRHPGGWQGVQSDLAACVDPARQGCEPSEIKHLRAYARYLAPKEGLLSGDTITIVTTYLRNLILNLILLFLVFASILMLPRLLILAFHRVSRFEDTSVLWWTAPVLFLAIALLVVGVAAVSGMKAKRPPPESHSFRKWVRTVVRWANAIAFLLAAWLVATRWPGMKPPTKADLGRWMVVPAAVYMTFWLLATWYSDLRRTEVWGILVRGSQSLLRRVAGRARTLWAAEGRGTRGTSSEDVPAARDASPAERPEVGPHVMGRVAKCAKDLGVTSVQVARTRRVWSTAIAGLFAGAIGGALLFASAHLLTSWFGKSPGQDLHTACVGAPLVAVLLTLIAVFHVGLAGKGFTEMERECWSRLGADLLLVTGLMVTVNTVALYGPWALRALHENFGQWMTSAGLSAGWILTSVAGAVAGRSEASGKASTSLWLRALCVAAPPVFIAGALGLVALAIDTVLPPLMGYHLGDVPAWDRIAVVETNALFVPFGVCLVLAALLSWRLGTNRFSMHGLYENRLVRCYLGASNGARRTDTLSGFDGNDDEKLLKMRHPFPRPDSEIADGGPPLHILNAALNLVGGDDLARQQRKAASFIMTPLHSGYELELAQSPDGEGPQARCSPPGSLSAYRATGKWVDLSLGAAMTVSGAAASPNMGYHSSAPLAFLMTVFNVRLGMWVRNPLRGSADSSEEPPLGLAYLIFELLGLTHEKRGYVYLSDGGHFENLGVYELLKRRCRFIIASDAGCDPFHEFADLSNLIQKARIDLRTEIETMDMTGLRLGAETGFTRAHCAVAGIRYPDGVRGTLIYLKASLSGDEAEDLLNYRKCHKAYPHESTGDQFFTESQFEVYRSLGARIGEEVFGEQDDLEGMESDVTSEVYPGPEYAEMVLERVAERWRIAPPKLGDRFLEVARDFQTIEERLRGTPGLQTYDLELNPELALLLPSGPAPADTVRESFHLANMQFQLMENVYTALDLRTYSSYPDFAGWMNLFRRWSSSERFRTAWAISRSLFGERFRRFVESPKGVGLVPLDLKMNRLNAFDEEDRPIVIDQATRILAVEGDGARMMSDLEADMKMARNAPALLYFTFPISGRPSLVAMAALGSLEKSMDLRWLVVRRDLRRLGFGRRILDRIISGEREAGSKLIISTPGDQPGARALLLMNGFKPKGPTLELVLQAPGKTPRP